MLLSKRMMANFIDEVDQVDDQLLAQTFNALGAEVESIAFRPQIEYLRIGVLVDARRHPHDATLSVCRVRTAPTQYKTIVTDAKNVRGQAAKNKCVVIALVGAELPNGTSVKTRNVSGVISDGLLPPYVALNPDQAALVPESEVNDAILLEDAKPFDVQVGKYLCMDDVLFDVSLPHNRPDWQGARFLCVEVAAKLGLKFLDTTQHPIAKLGSSPFGVRNQAGDACAHFDAIYLRNRHPRPSPWQVKSLLMNHGIRPVNDVVDNCTLIALMTGNPTHVYDAKKINGELCVLQATENEDFIGLDGKNYKIAPGDLIVRDKQKTVSLAGIIGSKLTAVSAETTSFLVEVGNFNPTVVASTARRLNAQTLAARMCAKKVSLYATKLTGEHIYNFMLRDSSPQQIGALTNPLTTGPYKNKITIDYAAIQSLIATRETLSVFRIRSILRSLGFHIVRGVVLVPAHRDDVIINQDLVEEVMKIVSIDVINGEPVAPAMYAPDSGNEPYLLLQNLIDRLRALQLNHLHTYNLTDRDSALSFDLFGYGEPLNIAAAPERAYFRLSLLDGLLRALAYNLKRKNEAQALFEVQPILTARGDDHWHVCIILPQPLFAAAWHNQAGIAPDLLTLKGLAEVVTDNFGFTCEHQPLTTSDWLVPADALCLQVYDETIGYAGRIRPSALKRYGLEETPIYALDVNLDKLIKSLNRAQDQYVPYWHGQNVVRDITFSPGPKSTFNDFIKGIKQIPEIASWKLISSFVPETTNEKKSATRYTVRYCLQQREGTLTTEAISAIATKLHNTLKKLDFAVDE